MKEKLWQQSWQICINVTTTLINLIWCGWINSRKQKQQKPLNSCFVYNFINLVNSYVMRMSSLTNLEKLFLKIEVKSKMPQGTQQIQLFPSWDRHYPTLILVVHLTNSANHTTDRKIKFLFKMQHDIHKKPTLNVG